MADSQPTPTKPATNADASKEPAAVLGTRPRRRRFRILLLIFLLLLAAVIGLLVFWPYYANRALGSLKLKQCPQKLEAYLTGVAPGSRDLSHAAIAESYVFHGQKYAPTEFNVSWVKAHCKVPVSTAAPEPTK